MSNFFEITPDDVCFATQDFCHFTEKEVVELLDKVICQSLSRIDAAVTNAEVSTVSSADNDYDEYDDYSLDNQTEAAIKEIKAILFEKKKLPNSKKVKGEIVPKQSRKDYEKNKKRKDISRFPKK